MIVWLLLSPDNPALMLPILHFNYLPPGKQTFKLLTQSLISSNEMCRKHFLLRDTLDEMICTADSSKTLPLSLCYSLPLPVLHCPVGRKAMTNLDSTLKSRDITVPTKVHPVKAMVFQVVMYRYDSWTIRRLSTKQLMLWKCAGEDS